MTPAEGLRRHDGGKVRRLNSYFTFGPISGMKHATNKSVGKVHIACATTFNASIEEHDNCSWTSCIRVCIPVLAPKTI